MTRQQKQLFLDVKTQENRLVELQCIFADDEALNYANVNEP
jgi:hypothetical protein